MSCLLDLVLCLHYTCLVCSGFHCTKPVTQGSPDCYIRFHLKEFEVLLTSVFNCFFFLIYRILFHKLRSGSKPMYACITLIEAVVRLYFIFVWYMYIWYLTSSANDFSGGYCKKHHLNAQTHFIRSNYRVIALCKMYLLTNWLQQCMGHFLAPVRREKRLKM